MAKAELGTKRVCPNCGTKYYDLDRDPIVCPRCGTRFEVPTVRGRAAAPRPQEVTEEQEPQPVGEAELVSLDEVEAEEEAAAGGGDDGEDVEVADGEEDDTFPAPEEEEEDDVTDIIGEVDEEER